MQTKTKLTEYLKDRIATEIDIIYMISDDEILYTSYPEDEHTINDPDYAPLKKEFKNILPELREHQIPLIGFYDDKDEDPDPYTDLMEYIRQLHSLAEEDFNYILESSDSTYPLNYNAINLISIASEDEYDLLNTLDDKNNEITLTAHHTIFNEIVYTLRIHDYKYLDQVYELQEDQMIRLLAEYNQNKIIYIEMLREKIGLEIS